MSTSGPKQETPSLSIDLAGVKPASPRRPRTSSIGKGSPREDCHSPRSLESENRGSPSPRRVAQIKAEAGTTEGLSLSRNSAFMPYKTHLVEILPDSNASIDGKAVSEKLSGDRLTASTRCKR